MPAYGVPGCAAARRAPDTPKPAACDREGDTIAAPRILIVEDHVDLLLRGASASARAAPLGGARRGRRVPPLRHADRRAQDRRGGRTLRPCDSGPSAPRWRRHRGCARDQGGLPEDEGGRAEFGTGTLRGSGGRGRRGAGQGRSPVGDNRGSRTLGLGRGASGYDVGRTGDAPEKFEPPHRARAFLEPNFGELPFYEVG